MAALFNARKSAPTGSGLIGYKVGWNTTVDLTGIDISSIGSIVSSLVGSGTTLPTYWNAVGKTEVDIRGTGEEIGFQVRLIFVVTKDGNARVIGATTAGANIGFKLKSFTIPREVEYNGTKVHRHSDRQQRVRQLGHRDARHSVDGHIDRVQRVLVHQDDQHRSGAADRGDEARGLGVRRDKHHDQLRANA